MLSVNLMECTSSKTKACCCLPLMAFKLTTDFHSSLARQSDGHEMQGSALQCMHVVYSLLTNSNNTGQPKNCVVERKSLT